MIISKAQYRKPDRPEYTGNPLIEAMPSPISKEDLFFEISYYPDLSTEVAMNATSEIRTQFVSRVKTLRCPQARYYECYSYIYNVIRESYASRNPLSNSTVQYLHYSAEDMPSIVPSDGRFSSNAEIITVTGQSGVGKTTMIERVLECFSQIVEHDQYRGEFAGLTTQVMWMKINCPYNASIRDLCEAILFGFDDIFGKPREKPSPRIFNLIEQISKRIKSQFLGILVIDEMQRIKISRTGGENKLIDFLHKIVDELGVSMLFCGNPEFEETLKTKMRFARRAETGGFMRIEPLKYLSTDWQTFVRRLWELQWTKPPTPLDNQLNETLHRLARGNLGVAQMIWQKAQLLVIGSGNEVITPIILNSAVPALTGTSQEFLQNVLLTNVFTGSGDEPISVFRTNNQPSPEKTEFQSEIIKGDLTRVQHPEFELQSNKVVADLHMHLKKINFTPFIRQIACEQGSFDDLQPYGLLCTDPLRERSGLAGGC